MVVFFGGGFLYLQDWWMKLLSIGCQFGYHVNVTNLGLLSRRDYLASAQHNLVVGIQITSTGQLYLGAALGSAQFIKDHT